MSRAFIREDVDPPERSGRTRSPSGLPPGATNYITARGARRLEEDLARAGTLPESAERVAELERILGSVTVVEPPAAGSSEVAFGATVTVERPNGCSETFTIVGVDELDFFEDGVSWVSSLGKALLGSELNGRVWVGGELVGRIIGVEYRG